MPIVGLNYLMEYCDGNNYCPPYYHCGISDCRDSQGDAAFMKRHIFSPQHRAAWLKSQDIVVPLYTTASEVFNFAKECSENLSDYCLEVISDRDQYKMYRDGRIRKPRYPLGELKNNLKSNKRFKFNNEPEPMNDYPTSGNMRRTDLTSQVHSSSNTMPTLQSENF